MRRGSEGVAVPAQFFTKCGILKDDDDGKPRVKLYKDRATGMLKGDGLVYYLKQPSVSCACPVHGRAVSCASGGTKWRLAFPRLHLQQRPSSQACFPPSAAQTH